MTTRIETPPAGSDVDDGICLTAEELIHDNKD